MNLINCVLCLSFLLKPIFSLNVNELKLSLDLIAELQIRQCILLENARSSKMASDVKNFSAANIPVSYLNLDQLVGFIGQDVRDLPKMGLVFNEKDLYRLSKISQTLEKENKSYLMAQYNWIVFLVNSQENLATLIVPYNCEFILIQSENSTTYALTEYYAVKNKSFFFDFGTWDNEVGLKQTNIAFYMRRKNLQKSVVTVTSFQPSYLQYCPYIRSDGCLAYELINELAFIMNFRIEKTQFSQKWEGDIVDVPQPFDSRLRNFDTLGPITSKEIQWYIKYPRPKTKSNYYLQPFELRIWLAVLCIILISTALIILQHFTGNAERFIIDDLFIGFESFCNQRGSNLKNASTRLTYILIRLNALIIIASYVIGIRLLFTTGTTTYVEPPFTNLEEFIQNGQYRLQTRRHSSLDLYLATQNDLFSRHIYNNFIEFLSDEEDLGRSICYGGKFAISGVDADILDIPCALLKIPQPITSFFLVLLLQKNSPFTKMFNYNYHRFYESGVQKRTRSIFWASSQTMKYMLKPVELQLMSQVFLIPLIGVLLAIPIVVVECLSKCCSLKKANKPIERF